jgi:polyhydroxybutyrate depolymerase
MRRLVLALCLVLGAARPGGSAQPCGGETACEIAGGIYHVALPEGPPRGILIFLHGYGGSGLSEIRNAALVRSVTERGYIFLAPSGEPRPGRTGGSWNSFADPARRDDVAFLRTVAEDAALRFAIPRERILLAGFSGGGMMAWRVACDAPAAFAAYAPVAGLLWRPLPETCAGPVRMLHTHGWSDQVVPLEGRTVGSGFATQGDLFVGLDLLRAASACVHDNPDAFGAREQYLLRRWTACAPGATIEMALHPKGHMVPGGWAGLTLDWFAGLSPVTARACVKEGTEAATC